MTNMLQKVRKLNVDGRNVDSCYRQLERIVVDMIRDQGHSRVNLAIALGMITARLEAKELTELGARVVNYQRNRRGPDVAPNWSGD